MEVKMKKIIIFIFFVVLLFFSCNKTNDSGIPIIKTLEEGNKTYDVYIPISTKYNGIDRNEFSQDWEYFCIFDEEHIAENDLNMLEDVRKDGNNITLSIVKEDYVIVCGLYIKKDGNKGSFIAKLNSEKTAVLELLELDDGRDKLIYLEDRGDIISIIKRLYSVNLYYVDCDDITVLRQLSYD